MGSGCNWPKSLAARMHRHILRELGLGKNQGKRYSPGFPAWPELADQQKLVRLLHAGKIGVTLSEKFQLIPELSVSAMVVCHPRPNIFDERYARPFMAMHRPAGNHREDMKWKAK